MDVKPGQQPDADAQFAEAFNEMAGPDQGSDAEGGAIPEDLPAEVVDASGAQEAAQETTDTATPEGDNPNEAGGLDVEAAASEGAPATTEGGASDIDTRLQELQRQEQRLKSWEGRLKAEARKKGLPENPDGLGDAEGGETGAEGAEQIQRVADEAAHTGDAELAAAAEDLAEKVNDAEITVQDARRILSEDFGDSFLQLIDVLVRDGAGQHSGKALSDFQASTTAEIEGIKNAYQRNHFKQIHKQHSDFKEVAATPEFQAFLAEDPERLEISRSGDALDVIDLLSQFKQQTQTIQPTEKAAQPAQDDIDMDGAEAVRATGGLNLPAAPAKDISYEEAWATL